MQFMFSVTEHSHRHYDLGLPGQCNDKKTDILEFPIQSPML